MGMWADLRGVSTALRPSRPKTMQAGKGPGTPPAYTLSAVHTEHAVRLRRRAIHTHN